MEKLNRKRFSGSGLICAAFLFFLSFLNIPYIYAAGKVVGISGDAESYRVKGYEAQERGDIDTAIEWYQKSANLKPDYAAPHNDLGILFETKGWLDRAESEYQKALAINPDYKEVHTNIALLYERKGELEKAAFHWLRRYRLGRADDPWTQEAKTRLEKLGLLEKKDYVQKLIEKKSGTEPKKKRVCKKKDSSGWSKVGAGLPRTEVLDTQVLGTEVKPAPTKSKKTLERELQESLRLAEERLKKERRTTRKYAEEKAKEPDVKAVPVPSSSSFYNKAKDYYDKGEYSKALDTIRTAKTSFPEDKALLALEEDIKNKMKEERIEDHYKQGMMYFRQKDYARARKEFEAILSILPE